jgi:RNA polymerase sigma-70 factor (ECF subfamily)
MIGALALPGVGVAVPGEVERAVGPEQLPVETALARAAAGGDRSAFARLIDVHKRSVLGLCTRLLGAGEAQDAAQETFARAWSGIAGYDPAQPFAPWVLRIARNHCLDLLRRRLPAARTVELDAARADVDPPELAEAGATAADERLARAQLAASVEAAVAALPENYREVIQLFHVEHLSYREIAATMDVPIGTVMSWLHRARAQLRVALAGREGSP